jgi:hypothetical protein
LRQRLLWLTVGTLGFILAMPVIVIPPPGDGNWLFWSLLFGKVGLGMWILLKALDYYRCACFPPGSAALSDPVALWFLEREAALKKRSWILWFLSQILLLFMPVLMMGFLALVVARPFYATFRHPQPSFAFLWGEILATLRFLWASAKGLFFLTLATLLGSASALGTIALILWKYPA